MNIAVTLRTRESNNEVVQRIQHWKASETAIIVCDMWDMHHCPSASKRICEMAPRMNAVLEAARELGVVIVHSPADCISYYDDHPARLNVNNCPKDNPPPPGVNNTNKIANWFGGSESPFDLTELRCDCTREDQETWNEAIRKKSRSIDTPWQQQITTLRISDDDFISAHGKEIWHVFEHRGIVNVILVGVHTNACVVRRPYGLIQMMKNGKNTVLMRDMTDSYCNPKGISHDRANELVIEFIEKEVCPTITSNQIAGDEEFRFK